MLALFSRSFHSSLPQIKPIPIFTRLQHSRARIMSRRGNLDVSPPIHRGMKDRLDKDLFKKSIPVLGVKVTPEKVHNIMKSEPLRSHVLDLPKVTKVLHAPDGQRIIVLRVSSESELSPETQEFLRSESAELVKHTVDLDYDYWSVEEILDAILPEELIAEAPRGYAGCGHIAHINLNKEYLPYKHIIGQLILDKIPTIKTVVNKTENIGNQFRVFPMELLAGEPNYEVTHHEQGCKFVFDFSKVYWNSRLGTEHERLVNLFTPNDVVADVFAGVGPFAIPASKRGSAVLANDLNPESFKYLQRNIEGNKVSRYARAFNEDGRVFIRKSVSLAYDRPFPSYIPPKSQSERKKEAKVQRHARGTNVPKPSSPENRAPPRRRITQYVMNLPDSAITFLDAFRGLLSPENVGKRDLSGVYDKASLPMVHCYCFTKEFEEDKAAADIRQRVEEKLGAPLDEKASFHHVRSVAPNKEMFCVSFRLSPEVVLAS